MEKEGRYSNRIEELLPNYPVHAIYVVDGGWTARYRQSTMIIDYEKSPALFSSLRGTNE